MEMIVAAGYVVWSNPFRFVCLGTAVRPPASTLTTSGDTGEFTTTRRHQNTQRWPPSPARARLSTRPYGATAASTASTG